MIKEEDKIEIIKEFRTLILSAEKENLFHLTQKGDSLMVENLKNEFEKVVKKHENN